MLALKRLPEKHTLITLAAQTNKRTQILIQAILHSVEKSLLLIVSVIGPVTIYEKLL